MRPSGLAASTFSTVGRCVATSPSLPCVTRTANGCARISACASPASSILNCAGVYMASPLFTLSQPPPRRASARPAASAAVASKSALRSRFSSTTSGGALATKLALASLASILPISACALSISRVQPRALGVHVDDAGQRQRRRRLAEHDLRRALRRAPWRTRCVSRRASRLMVSSCRSARARVGLAGADQHQRDLGAGRHVHLRAHRAHLADELDQPADLLVGSRIGEPLEHGPGRQAQQALALRCRPRPVVPTAPR